MTLKKRGVDEGGERSGRWQIERREEEGLLTVVGKTSMTTEIGSVEDLEVLPPNPPDGAKTATPNLEAQEIAHHRVEIAGTKISDHREKALQHR
jgi:hypothetical protein